MNTDEEKTKAKWILATGVALFAIGQSLLFIIVAPLVRTIGITELQFGVTFGLANIPLIIAAPIWGKKSDSLGRKPIFLVGMYGSTVGTVAVALALESGLNNWFATGGVLASLFFARALYSSTASAIYPASSGYMADVTDRSGRAQAMAIIGGANSLGSILGPALGAGLVFLGVLFPMYAAAVLMLVGSVWATFYLKEPERHAETRRASSLRPTDPRLVPYMIMWASFFLVFISINFVTAFYIEDRFGVTDPARVAQFASGALFCMGVVITVVQLGIMQKVRPKPRTMLRLWGPCYFVALLTIALAPNIWVMMLGYGMIGFAFSFATPGINGSASLAVEPHEQGTAAGYLAAANTVGGILGPMAGPALYSLAPRTPMLTGAAIFAVLSLYVFTLKSPDA